MMNKLVFFGLFLVTFLWNACVGKSPKPSTPQDSISHLTFRLPQVPVMLQTPESRLRYVVMHYWMHFDFVDTAYIHVPEVTEQALANYMDLLARVSVEEADSCLVQTLRSSLVQEKMFHYFAETFRRYLFDPNSPMRNETLYEPVARFVSSCSLATNGMRSRAQHDLKLVRMNGIGDLSNDFEYTLKSGEHKRMHGVCSPYILLLFYNPDCQGCQETISAIQRSQILESLMKKKKLTVFAFYPDEDLEVWRRYQSMLPEHWINGYDRSLTVLSQELYDLKAMPSLYLLDHGKRVLLKDVAVGEIEAYFENNLR